MATGMSDDDERTRQGERIGDERLDRDDAGDREAGGPDLEHDPEAAKTVNRFDIRRLIGGVFVLYGLVLTALGLFGSHEIKNKAAGINVDLWTGLAMLVVGGLMLAWALSRPVAPEHPTQREPTGAAPSPARGSAA